MKKNWDITSLDDKGQELALLMTHQCQFSPVVSTLLVQRGVPSAEEVENFWEPKLSDLHDPFLMPGMDKAVDRIERAIRHQENILIYGDYDVDGTTAVTLVCKYLRRFTSSLDYYIPDRYSEGSGISPQGIQYAADHNVSLIIALDCGVKDRDAVHYASELGIDCIICDHHVPDAELPEAVAILNAKLAGSTYPFNELSGCGVGFKLMQAFALRNHCHMHEVYALLDLVVVSIAADIVPLVGENRILAHHGLRQLNHSPSTGLREIIKSSGIKTKELSISDITFKIGPRLNASGRIQSGKESVDLLLANNATEARRISHLLEEYNKTRRSLDRETTLQALDIAAGLPNLAERKLIIVYDPSWHMGVIGIVASRLADKYNRPAVVLTDTNDTDVCGSARAPEGFDVYNILESCKDLLKSFGGHPYAAGMTVAKDDLGQLIQRMCNEADCLFSNESVTPHLYADAELQLSDITPLLRKELRRFPPYGPGNEKPIFCTRGVVCVTPPTLAGRKQTHLSMVVGKEGELPFFEAFAYNQSEYAAAISHQPFDILYTIEEPMVQGVRKVQLIIQSIHVPEPSGQ